MTLFVLLLISHILGDGLIKYRRLAELKRDARFSRQILAVIVHACPHAVFAGVLFGLAGLSWLSAASLVFIFHFLIDFLRCRIEIRLFGAGGLNFADTLAYFLGTKNDPGKPDAKTLKTWAFSNIIDQGAHVGSLLLITRII
jgi:hypothetical protein